MSSQKGNLQRDRPQKHQNRTAFKNTVHDTSKKTKKINTLIVTGVCQRCKDAIDWKIKYKKYKPLKQAKTCTKCHMKTVLQAYYNICIPCAQEIKVCQKCGEQKDTVLDPVLSPAEQAARDAELQFELKRLPERQRRTFFRQQVAGKLTSDNLGAVSNQDTCSNHGCDSDSESEDIPVSAACGGHQELSAPCETLLASEEIPSSVEPDPRITWTPSC